MSSLRYIFFAGSPLHSDLIRKWRATFPNGTLVNLYGTTETPQGRTHYEVPQTESLIEGVQPIGRPIANTQALVLRGNDQRCGVGEVGEIAIRTPFSSLGYLDAEQTRERFVPNPFRDDPNDLLYRTGDLGRYRPDGSLDILGRLDDQVKIGGVRIEPAEIASLLSVHEQVGDCHVAAVSYRPGEPQLIAWVVPSPGSSLTSSELRRHLATKLPSSLIPSRFVLLDALPLTPSGKVDRRSLPVPDDSRPELETGFVAPRNPIEQQLVSIWCEVLELEAVGVQDNFFALGGHSLLAMRLHARITSLWQIDLPLRRLFEAPTIAELASEIKPLRGGGVLSSSTTLTRVDRDQLDHLPLSFSQQRLWFLEQMEPELTAYNMPYAWMLRGPLDPEALRRALEEVVRRHEPLRTSFP